MPKIILNGFVPGNAKNPREDTKNALIAVFLSRKYNTMDAELLFEASPDESGSIIHEVSDDYIGEKITIVFIDLKFIEQHIEKEILEIGVFHSFNLEKDYCLSDSMKLMDELDRINTNKMYSDAQSNMIKHIRESKYNNKIIKVGANISIFISPFIGLVVASIPGVIIGIVISGIIYKYNPYINGDKKCRIFNKTGKL